MEAVKLGTPIWFADYVKKINPSKLDVDGSHTEILNRKVEADKEVVKAMICDFINQAKSKNLDVKANKIGFDFYDNCLMVWLEVYDRQEVTKYDEIEKYLNENFKTTGFRILATIVSDWDGFTPSNYTSVQF